MVFFIKPSVCDLETIFEIVEAGNEYPMAEATFPVAEAVPESGRRDLEAPEIKPQN